MEITRRILFANDVVLFCRTLKEPGKILNILNDTFRRFDLAISFKKTKTQVFNNEDLLNKDSLSSIGPEKIEKL